MSLTQGSLYGGGLVPLPVYLGPAKASTGASVYMTPSFIAKDTFLAPPTASPNAYVLAKTGAQLPSGASGGTVTFAPDGAATGGVVPGGMARNVTVNVSATAVVAMTGTINGFDRYGRALSEAWSVPAGGAGQVFTGKKAFYRVMNVVVTSVANAGGNLLNVGTGNVLGLNFPCAIPSAVKEVALGAIVTTGILVAASSDPLQDRRGTYAPSAAPNGVADYTVYYLVDTPAAI